MIALALVAPAIACLAVARDRGGRDPAARRAPAVGELPDATFDVADAAVRELVAAHRRWNAAHGAGCARSAEHLLPYTSLATTDDPWGTPMQLWCERLAVADGAVVSVSITSAGPDAVFATVDDRGASDEITTP